MRGDAKHCPGSDVFADGTPAVCPFITRQCIQRITVAEENGWHPVSQVHESSSDDERLLPSHHPDLPHQPYVVVKKFLLNDLAVFPVGNGAKLDLEAFVRGRNLFAVSPFHRPFHRTVNLAMEHVQSPFLSGDSIFGTLLHKVITASVFPQLSYQGS